jgi:hypothetical protein
MEMECTKLTLAGLEDFVLQGRDPLFKSTHPNAEIGVSTARADRWRFSGCLYGMPSDATTILRIDLIKDEATTFGTVRGASTSGRAECLATSTTASTRCPPTRTACCVLIPTGETTPTACRHRRSDYPTRKEGKQLHKKCSREGCDCFAQSGCGGHCSNHAKPAQRDEWNRNR